MSEEDYRRREQLLDEANEKIRQALSDLPAGLFGSWEKHGVERVLEDYKRDAYETNRRLRTLLSQFTEFTEWESTPQ